MLHIVLIFSTIIQSPPYQKQNKNITMILMSNILAPTDWQTWQTLTDHVSSLQEIWKCTLIDVLKRNGYVYQKNLEHQEFQSNVTLHFKFLQDAFRSSKIKINKSLDTQSILRLQTVKLLKILAQELYTLTLEKV